MGATLRMDGGCGGKQEMSVYGGSKISCRACHLFFKFKFIYKTCRKLKKLFQNWWQPRQRAYQLHTNF